MHHIQKVIVLLSSILFFISMSAETARAADRLTINALIEHSMNYDGQEVMIQGEAIGEVLERGQYAWVNLNDGGNAIGIWMPLEDAKKIAYFGDYKNIGDTIRITGTFSRNCLAHGGDVDIHSSTIEFVAAGHPVAEVISPAKILSALILVLLAIVELIVYSRTVKKHDTDKKIYGLA